MMERKVNRRFSSYGPIDKNIHYYAPRKDLLDLGVLQLSGKEPEKGGHYITVWAPRQAGKSTLLNEAVFKLRQDKRFDVLKVNLEHLKIEHNIKNVLNSIGSWIVKKLDIDIFKDKKIDNIDMFQGIFEKGVLRKPFILILDEFDALAEDAISAIVSAFRNIYNIRQEQSDLDTEEKDYLLHSVALIGVRGVLGLENESGSPFNVQRSLHIPNLSFEEVADMFRWYEQDSGRKVDQEVIERLYYEFRGQPGLTCWFGELLSEGWDGFKIPKGSNVDMNLFKRAYKAATQILPNANILNIIKKARQKPYKEFVAELFRTDAKTEFKYDDDNINFLYTNGIIDKDQDDKGDSFIRFSCPFVHKRLFSNFAREMFQDMGRLYDPFDNIEEVITENSLNIKKILEKYQKYLSENSWWLFKNAPRRSDMRLTEAVLHFNIYNYIDRFLQHEKTEVYPEFPTGNGKIDIIIKHAGKIYVLELKSYTNKAEYKKALKQAARYGKKLGTDEITLVFFVENIDKENKEQYEKDFLDKDTRVKVVPIFIETAHLK